MSSVLSREEKERILKALEEDREFRYALMGLLGYKEILDRITLLESRFAKLEERFADLEKRFADLEERFIKLEERVARLEERVLRVEEELAETRRVVIVIAHRFGVITEEAFRSAMRYVLEEVFGVAKVSKWVYSDKEGLVYGRPSLVDVDVLVKDREHILVEVKSRVSKGDVAELSRIGVLYERVEGIKPRLVILGGFIDEGVYELARELGVEIRPIFKSAT